MINNLAKQLIRIEQLLRAFSGAASNFYAMSTRQFALKPATNQEANCCSLGRRDRAGDPIPHRSGPSLKKWSVASVHSLARGPVVTALFFV
jgi:hypothetical protein